MKKDRESAPRVSLCGWDPASFLKTQDLSVLAQVSEPTQVVPSGWPHPAYSPVRKRSLALLSRAQPARLGLSPFPTGIPDLLGRNAWY